MIKIKLLKRLFLVFITGLVYPSANAQTTYTESFDGVTFLPTGWSSVGSTTLWSRRTSGTFPTCANHSGAGMARFGARGVAAKSIQTIASPVFDLSDRGSNSPKISLWIYRDNGSNLGDSLSIYVNTSASLTSAVLIGTIARYSRLKMPDTVAVNGWYQYSYTIPSVFNTTSNFILLKGIGEAGYNIYLDDLQWDEYSKPCKGTPSPGNISALSSVLCGGTGSTVLSLIGQTSGFSGLFFQWKSSASISGSYTNFGTNASTVSTGVIASTRYYKCMATCLYTSKSDSTTVKSITVSATANPIITILPNAATYCQGSSVHAFLKATCNTAKSYAWSPSTGLNRTDTSDVNSAPAATTVYTATGTDSIGCIGTATVTVTLRQLPVVTFTASDSIMCLGDSVMLTAATGTGYSYLWVPTGQTVYQIFAKPTTKTNYAVTVTGTYGCSTTVSKNIYVNLKPDAKFGYNISGRRVDFHDSSENGSIYEWDFGDGNGSKKQNPVYIFVDDGNYSVKLIVNNPPCQSDTIIKTISIALTGINEKVFKNGINIYPNPAKNFIKISVNTNTKPKLIIYNTLGEEILNRMMTSNSETIDISSLAIGVYNVAIFNNGIISNYRLVKVED